MDAFAPAGTQVICALRPKARQFHLATADEAMKYSGLAGVQQFVLSPAFVAKNPSWFTAVQATDGAPPANTPWLLSLCPGIAHQQSRDLIESLKLKPARCSDATLATAGALATSVSSPTLVLEIGELTSHAFLIGPQGVMAEQKLRLNLDQIAEAVQQELKLKFKGSAAKLFFNPDCNFTESGANIATRLGNALKVDLAPMLVGQPAPQALSCTGLPAQQHWLEIQLATVLNLRPHVPDIKAWSSELGVTFATPELEASISPAWFNFLHFINSQTIESSTAVPWQAELHAVGTPIAPKTATPSPIPVKNATTLTPPPSTTASGSKKTPDSVKKMADTDPKAKSAPATNPDDSVRSSVKYSSKPPTDTTHLPAGNNKIGLFIGVGIAVLALAIGAFFYRQTQEAEKAQIALAKQQADQKAHDETERARLAEQKAREESETRKKFELETSKKLAEAAAALQQAEEEARIQSAARLANARGAIVINTQPAGAMVTLGDLPARPSPATFTFVKIGKHSVTITLPHHEDQVLELEVKENITTTSNTIQLASKVGAVNLTSEPSGTTFELRPTNPISESDDAVQRGQTPATLANLIPGEYTVTYSRSGWSAHTETVSVARNEVARSHWEFPGGTLKITSTPTGATVLRNGERIGTTPLDIRRPAGMESYDLILSQYDNVTLSGMIEENKTLELSATMAEADILYNSTDLDKNPEPINPKIPELSSAYTLVEGRVVIQLTINRDGSPSDLKLVRASNAEIGKIYLAALAKWKFKPGIKNGKPVRTSVVIPFLIQASRD